MRVLRLWVEIFFFFCIPNHKHIANTAQSIIHSDPGFFKYFRCLHVCGVDRGLKYKTLRSACEVLVLRNTRGEQWTFKPHAHRKYKRFILRGPGRLCEVTYSKSMRAQNLLKI